MAADPDMSDSPFFEARRDIADLLDRIEIPSVLSQSSHDCDDVIALEEFRPVSEGLEWELAGVHWNTHADRPFVRGDVPFVVNNSGWAAESAALLLHAIPRDDLCVLELGAGSGLFTRQLLRAHERIAQSTQKLHIILSDASPSSVRTWSEHGLFAGFEDRVSLAVADAMDPSSLRSLDGDPIEAKELDAVFANYLLDALPLTIINRDGDALVQRVARSLLPLDPASLRRLAGIDVEQATRLAESEDPEERARLAPLLPILEFEAAWEGLADPGITGLEELLAVANDHLPATLSHGAILCIERWMDKLRPGGFFLAQDYGPATVEDSSRSAVVQRNGQTLATGVHFPLIETYFRSRGISVFAPSEGPRSVHARLLTTSAPKALTQVFLDTYGHPSVQGFETLASEAQQHIQAGHYRQALEIYRSALRICPSDWHLLGRAAEFLTQQLGRHEEAVFLAREALEENPCHSAWLWNTLGNSLAALMEQQEAHASYERARSIDPKDPQSWYNLSCSRSWIGDYEGALTAIANALANDRSGSFREPLLRQQEHLLRLLSQRWSAETLAATRRHETLRAD